MGLHTDIEPQEWQREAAAEFLGEYITMPSWMNWIQPLAEIIAKHAPPSQAVQEATSYVSQDHIDHLKCRWNARPISMDCLNALLAERTALLEIARAAAEMKDVFAWLNDIPASHPCYGAGLKLIAALDRFKLGESVDISANTALRTAADALANEAGLYVIDVHPRLRKLVADYFTVRQATEGR